MLRNTDILRDRTAEEERFLQYDSDIATQPFRLDIFNIDAADRDFALIRLQTVKSVKQQHQGGLAGTGPA